MNFFLLSEDKTFPALYSMYSVADTWLSYSYPD